MADERLLNPLQAGHSATLQNQAMVVTCDLSTVHIIVSRQSSAEQNFFKERVLAVKECKADGFDSHSEENELE